jgi:PEP-CTERM motif
MRHAARLVALSGLLLAVPAMNAATINISTGSTAQNFVLTGLGPVPPSGDGTYSIAQGACVSGGGSTTCSMTGSYTGSAAGYLAGTFDFITTYQGTDPLSIQGQSQNPTSDNFFYDFLSPTTNMNLELFDISGNDYNISLVKNGSFVPGTGFGFSYVTVACAGLPAATPCSQANVGQVPGATTTGPVTIGASFDTLDAVPLQGTTPEPSTLVLFGTGVLALAGAVRRKLLFRS